MNTFMNVFLDHLLTIIISMVGLLFLCLFLSSKIKNPNVSDWFEKAGFTIMVILVVGPQVAGFAAIQYSHGPWWWGLLLGFVALILAVNGVNWLKDRRRAKHRIHDPDGQSVQLAYTSVERAQADCARAIGRELTYAERQHIEEAVQAQTYDGPLSIFPLGPNNKN